MSTFNQSDSVRSNRSFFCFLALALSGPVYALSSKDDSETLLKAHIESKFTNMLTYLTYSPNTKWTFSHLIGAMTQTCRHTIKVKNKRIKFHLGA